jgi:hypothetical protein
VLLDGGHLAAQRGLCQAKFAGAADSEPASVVSQKGLEVVPIEVFHANSYM